MQQRGRADNRQISAFGRGDALGQRGHAQHMLEVVAAPAIDVRSASGVNGDGATLVVSICNGAGQTCLGRPFGCKCPRMILRYSQILDLHRLDRIGEVEAEDA